MKCLTVPQMIENHLVARLRAELDRCKLEKNMRNKSTVAPIWVTQLKLYGSRLTALIEECNNLQDIAVEALCKNIEVPEHLIKRMDDLMKASMDAYGYSYREKLGADFSTDGLCGESVRLGAGKTGEV